MLDSIRTRTSREKQQSSYERLAVFYCLNFLCISYRFRRYFLLRLQTTICLLLNTIVSVLPHYYSLSSEPNRKRAKCRVENSTQSPHTTMTRQREAAAKRQSPINTTERTAYQREHRSTALPEGSF